MISDATEYAAVLDVILSYHNLLDNYEDDNSKLSKLCAASLKSKYDEIKDTYQKQVLIIENYITSLKVAESRGETSIDIVSNLTGECLSKIFCWKDDIFSKDLSALGFYLGKFIYIMDAYEDLDKDEKNHKFNPLIKIRNESKDEFETFIKTHLTCLISECAKSFERLPIIENDTILRNIIYSGVWTRYEYLQLKKKKQS